MSKATDDLADALFDSAPHVTTTEGEFVPSSGYRVVTRAKLIQADLRALARAAAAVGAREALEDAQVAFRKHAGVSDWWLVSFASNYTTDEEQTT